MFKIRNCKIGTSIDYVISPVADKNGVFYDSRCCGDGLPKDGDANGAYNIARKGLMMARQIRACSDVNKVRFDTSNEEWLRFVQERPYAE
jgi:CRISPR-associated protein Cpf1